MQHAFISRNLVVHSPAEWNDYIICWHGWMDAEWSTPRSQENRASYGNSRKFLRENVFFPPLCTDSKYKFDVSFFLDRFLEPVQVDLSRYIPFNDRWIEVY